MEATPENVDKMLLFVEELACLPKAPTSPPALTGFAKQILKMCSDFEQAEWLISELGSRCQFWPAPVEARRVFCQRYRPDDGEEE